MTSYLLIAAEWIGVIAVVLILSISPGLKKRRPVKFTQPRQEGVGALSLVVLIILFTVLFANLAPVEFTRFVSFQTLDLQTAILSYPGPLTVANVITLAGFMAVCILPIIYFVRRKHQPWLSIGLKGQMISGGLQTGLALALVTIFLRGKLNSLIYSEKEISQLYLLLACLVAAFGEEVIFRGYLQPRLENWLGEKNGFALTAILSTVWAVLPLIGIGWMAVLVLIAYRLLLSILLGWIVKRTGSIIGGWLYHAVHLWLFWM